MPQFRISNYNYAGTILFAGLLVAPAIVIGLGWAWAFGGLAKDLEGPADWGTMIFLTVVVVGAAPVALVSAVNAAVLWVEFGEEVKIRTLLRTRLCQWTDLQPFEIETPS